MFSAWSRRAPLAFLAASALALTGCSGGAGDSDSPTAVASFYPLAWVTEQVAGEGWEVVNLTKPGVDPHEMTLDIAQSAAVDRADLVVLESGLQPVVDRSVEQNAAGTPVVDAAEAVTLRSAADHGGEGEDHDAEEHTSDDGHEHGALEGLDPHFWLDPLLMADLADAVAAELGEVDPEGQEGYTSRAEDVRAELEALDEEYVAGLESCERTTVVVSHDAFGYLERYGLEFEPIAGLSPDAEATPADLARLHELARAEGVTTVFSERLSSTKMAESLAGDLDITTDVLDPLEGLSDETSGEDYLSLMRANLAALTEANQCR